MKTTSDETDVVHMPPDLLAQARKAADEEHRPADELVSDAVRRYLESRLVQQRNEDLTRSQIAGQRIRELRKGVTLGGIPIKELIEEGRE